MTLGKTKTKEEVIEALHSVAAEMHDKMLKGKPPAMTLPVRTKRIFNLIKNCKFINMAKIRVQEMQRL